MMCFSTIYDPVLYETQRSIYIKTNVMKTIASLIFVLFIGVIAQAQTAEKTVRVDAVEMTGNVENISEEVFLEATTDLLPLNRTF